MNDPPTSPSPGAVLAVDRPLPQCVDESDKQPSATVPSERGGADFDIVEVKLVGAVETDENVRCSIVDDVESDIRPDHPGTQCAQFSCVALVGWSKSRGRYAKLCKDHLEAHRKRCARSAVRRRVVNREYREKARMYDIQSINLSQAHKEISRLQARLAESERELRRAVSSSNTSF